MFAVRSITEWWTLFPQFYILLHTANRLTKLSLPEYPDLVTLEARENQISEFGELNAPKLKNLYLVRYSAALRSRVHND
jgi:hypothetical protein